LVQTATLPDETEDFEKEAEAAEQEADAAEMILVRPLCP
jgi:hypothetical protein